MNRANFLYIFLCIWQKKSNFAAFSFFDILNTQICNRESPKTTCCYCNYHLRLCISFKFVIDKVLRQLYFDCVKVVVVVYIFQICNRQSPKTTQKCYRFCYRLLCISFKFVIDKVLRQRES